jgi:hypothetical protein
MEYLLYFFLTAMLATLFAMGGAGSGIAVIPLLHMLGSWGHKFIYINKDGKVELISLGADGKEGGKGDAADIKLSECK